MSLTFNTDEKRYSLFPLKYKDIYGMYQKHLDAFWRPEEIQASLAKDRRDFDKVSEGEMHFIRNVLAFFAASDALVNENLAENNYNLVVLLLLG